MGNAEPWRIAKFAEWRPYKLEGKGRLATYKAVVGAVSDLPSPLPPLFYMQSLVESPSGDALSTLNSVISMGLFYP